MFVGKTLVQRAIDGESTYAAVKDADGKGVRLPIVGFRIADFENSLNSS